MWAAEATAHAGNPGRGPGFTLIEILTVLAVMALGASFVFGGLSEVLLVQARLQASAKGLGDALVQARNHALFTAREVVFAYDVDENSYEAYYNVELDEDGLVLGPGRTAVIGPQPMRRGIIIASLLLPGADERLEGVVALTISRLGRVTPHDVVVLNPEFPETEVVSVRVSGLTNRYETVEGRILPEELSDASFR